MTGTSPELRGLTSTFVLTGTLDRRQVTSFLDEIRESSLEAGDRVLIDLRGFEGCDREVRSYLVTAQKALGRIGCRTAWLVDSPRTHGVAMWVVNLSGDPGARAAASLSLASRWLEAQQARLDENLDDLESALGNLLRWRLGS